MPDSSFDHAAAEIPPFSMGISTDWPLRLSVMVTLSGTVGTSSSRHPLHEILRLPGGA
jgi:hypothetical protein